MSSYGATKESSEKVEAGETEISHKQGYKVSTKERMVNRT